MGLRHRRVARRYRSEALRTIHDAAFELWGAGKMATPVMLRIEEMALTKPVVPASNKGKTWTASVAVVRS